MAGLGRMVVRGLGAAMQGYGRTLTEQDAERRREAALDGAAMRAQALATFQHGLSIDTVKQTAEANVGEHRANAQTDTVEMGKRLIPATKAKIEVEQASIDAKTRAEYELLPAKTKATLTIEEYRANAAMARAKLQEEGANLRQKGQQDFAVSTKPIGTVVNERGEETYVFAPGAAHRTVTARDSRPVSSVRPSDDGGYNPGNAAAVPKPAPPRAEEPAAPPVATPPEPPAPGADRTYTMSDLQYTARKNGISLNEARKQLNAAGYRLTP